MLTHSRKVSFRMEVISAENLRSPQNQEGSSASSRRLSAFASFRSGMVQHKISYVYDEPLYVWLCGLAGGVPALFLMFDFLGKNSQFLPHSRPKYHRLTQPFIPPSCCKCLYLIRLERTAFSRPSDPPFSTPPCPGIPPRCSPPISSPVNGTPFHPLTPARPLYHPYRRRKSISISRRSVTARRRRGATGVVVVGGD